MTETNFKELPVPSYFTYENIHYQKIAKTKVREFGTFTERIIRSNPQVTYWGQDINEMLAEVNESN